MIVVDTSVWIDFFDDKPTTEIDILYATLGNQEVEIGDLIDFDILRGFRLGPDWKTAKKYLLSLRQYKILSAELAVKAADNFRKLRAMGTTIRKTTDTFIATFCIAENLPLLYTDKDFIPFTKYLKLHSILPSISGLPLNGFRV